MQAHETNLLALLQGTKQFVIPIYQRTYNWQIKHCQRLWADICRTGADEKTTCHFIGSIVYIQDNLIATEPRLLVIDGQQRLTTIALLLLAMRDALKSGRVEATGVSPEEINHLYLANPFKKSDYRYKLLLTQADKNTLTRYIDEATLAEGIAPRLKENYDYFAERIATAETELDQVWAGLSKLVVVEIALDRSHDNPQLIFESLNSTGLDLSQADLIRNFILMGLEPDEQENLYKDYWYPMEQGFGQSGKFDLFMRNYIIIKTGRLPNMAEIYQDFKTYVRGKGVSSMREVAADVYKWARHYMRIAFAKEEDPEIRLRLADINALAVETSYPFLMQLYEDYANQRLSRVDLMALVRLIESYIFRRAICGVPTNSLDKTFAQLYREIDEEEYVWSVKAALMRKDANRRFPRGEEFRREFLIKDIYHLRIRDYILRKLENHGSKESIGISGLTIEHIMPQNANLSETWRTELGPNWSEVHKTWLHTIGNLTLTGYNSELSDRPFQEKKRISGGFADSHVKLNRSLAALGNWNEDEIKKRAEALADLALLVWPLPEVPEIDTGSELSAQEIMQAVFPGETEAAMARELLREVAVMAPGERYDHLLSITYRKDQNSINVVLGSWIVLRFIRSGNNLDISWCLDLGLLKTKPAAKRIFKFSKQWAGDKEIALMTLPWSNDLLKREELRQAWRSAVQQAYGAFGAWTATPFAGSHHRELAEYILGSAYTTNYDEALQGEMLVLFNKLRGRILALDSSVTEEYKKVYIAYKTGTNFVDLVPQKSKLRLSLNVHKDEIDDPDSLCRDVSEVNHWGNGDLEVACSKEEEIEDVMALVKQAFERRREEG